LDKNKGIFSIKIPKTNVPSGNYILRTELLALHQGNWAGGAQFYISCLDIKVTGGSGKFPTDKGVEFPGAYTPDTPGILFDVYSGKDGMNTVEIGKTYPKIFGPPTNKKFLSQK
jgi:lytic cellulose monooxygenase (C1-hydroxylating)